MRTQTRDNYVVWEQNRWRSPSVNIRSRSGEGHANDVSGAKMNLLTEEQTTTAFLSRQNKHVLLPIKIRTNQVLCVSDLRHRPLDIGKSLVDLGDGAEDERLSLPQEGMEDHISIYRRPSR